MWQQKQNNFTGLDELINLPGEPTVNKAALWQKLEHKLQKKPAHSNLWLYWAAAILIILTTLPFLFSGINNKTGVAITGDRSVNSRQIITEPIEKAKNDVATENLRFQKIKNNFPVASKEIIYQKNKISAVKALSDSFIPKVPVQLSNTALADLYANVDTVEIATPITTKKKLSVVHINELQDEDRMASQNKNTARSSKRHRAKPADKSEYAGNLNFRIYFKN